MRGFFLIHKFHFFSFPEKSFLFIFSLFLLDFFALAEVQLNEKIAFFYCFIENFSLPSQHTKNERFYILLPPLFRVLIYINLSHQLILALVVVAENFTNLFRRNNFTVKIFFFEYHKIGFEEIIYFSTFHVDFVGFLPSHFEKILFFLSL